MGCPRILHTCSEGPPPSPCRCPPPPLASSSDEHLRARQCNRARVLPRARHLVLQRLKPVQRHRHCHLRHILEVRPHTPLFAREARLTPGDPCSRPGSPLRGQPCVTLHECYVYPSPIPNSNPFHRPSTQLREVRRSVRAWSRCVARTLTCSCCSRCPHGSEGLCPHLVPLLPPPPPSPSHNEGRAVVARHDVAPVPSTSPSPPTHKRMAFDLSPNTASAVWCTLHKYTHLVA